MKSVYASSTLGCFSAREQQVGDVCPRMYRRIKCCGYSSLVSYPFDEWKLLLYTRAVSKLRLRIFIDDR